MKYKYELLKQLYKSKINRSYKIEILSVYETLIDYIIKTNYVDVIDIARITYKLSYDEVDSLINILFDILSNEELCNLLDYGNLMRYHEIINYLIFLNAIKTFQD